MGSEALPLLYTSTGQVNVQVPFDIPVNTQFQMTVQKGNILSVPESLVIAPAQPGVFTTNQQGTGQGVIVKSDGVTLAQPATPAGIGETVVIYCTGLGPVSPALAAGIARTSHVAVADGECGHSHDRRTGGERGVCGIDARVRGALSDKCRGAVGSDCRGCNSGRTAGGWANKSARDDGSEVECSEQPDLELTQNPKMRQQEG